MRVYATTRPKDTLCSKGNRVLQGAESVEIPWIRTVCNQKRGSKKVGWPSVRLSRVLDCSVTVLCTHCSAVLYQNSRPVL